MDNLPKRFYYKQNRHQQLRGFYYTGMYLSVSRAAQQLGLSQPTVTLQIQSLERDLSVKLFERSHARLELTEDGRILFEIAATHVEGLEDLYGRFFKAKENMRKGVLRISAGYTSTAYFLPPYLSRFTKAYPETKVQLRSLSSEAERFALLQEDKVDMLCGSLVHMSDEFRYIPVLTSDPVLVTPLNHPLTKKRNVTISDITKYDILMLPPQNTVSPALDFLYESYDRLNDHEHKHDIELAGWVAIKKYISIGLGISIIYEIGIESHDKVAVIPMKKHLPKRSYGVILRRNQRITKEMQAFLDILLQHPAPPISRKTNKS